MKAYVCIEDCGDGDVYPRFYASLAEAEAESERQLNEYGIPGWVHTINNLKEIDGVIVNV